MQKQLLGIVKPDFATGCAEEDWITRTVVETAIRVHQCFKV